MRVLHQWTPSNAGSQWNYRRKYRSIDNALRMIAQSTGGDLRECLTMLAGSTYDEPVLLFDGKGMIWLGTKAEKP